MMVRKILFKITFLLNLFRFYLRERSFLSLGDLMSARRVGLGISDTLVVAEKYIVKLRNSSKERVIRKEYLYPYEGYYEYWMGREKIRKEFEVLSRLHKLNLSPRPVRYGDYYLLVEYVDAASADACLVKDCSAVELVVGKIEELHNHGIYHGDLNLNNILIDSNRNVYFIDFETSYKAGTPEGVKRSLDYIILVEKTHRFYPEIFCRCGDSLIRAILRRDAAFVENTRRFATWLNPEIVKAVEQVHDNSHED